MYVHTDICHKQAHFFLGAPTFTRQMTSEQQAPAGSTVLLKCHATGAPAPHVSWFKDGQPYRRPYSYESPGRQGAASEGQVLALHNVKAEDSGEYRCDVINIAGQIGFTYTLSVVSRLGKQSLHIQMTNVITTSHIFCVEFPFLLNAGVGRCFYVLSVVCTR